MEVHKNLLLWLWALNHCAAYSEKNLKLHTYQSRVNPHFLQVVETIITSLFMG